MFKQLIYLKPFFDSPSKEFSVRDISRILKISPATASKYLKDFHKQNILQYRKERMLDLYLADISSQTYRDIKIFYNIRLIRESGLIEELNDFYLKPTIILFGSMSNAYDREESDIDLFIQCASDEEFPKQKHFEKLFSKDLQIFVHKTIKGVGNKHLMNNIISGIVLQGVIRGFE